MHPDLRRHRAANARTNPPRFLPRVHRRQALQWRRAEGQPFVLYFYPKDNTPGCTTEGQQFRDLHPQFRKLGCAVFGVSRDSLKSHESFKAKMEFPFELLSDADEEACELFGVIKMKNMYGKQVRGIERSTFVVDAEGVVAQGMARREGARPCAGSARLRKDPQVEEAAA